MTLKPPVSITPDQAKAKITAALVRKARFDARQVTVAITGSEIELTGTVSSLAEFREAANVAWSTPGVTHVDNLLTVAPASPARRPLGESQRSRGSGRVTSLCCHASRWVEHCT